MWPEHHTTMLPPDIAERRKLHRITQQQFIAVVQKKEHTRAHAHTSLAAIAPLTHLGERHAPDCVPSANICYALAQIYLKYTAI